MNVKLIWPDKVSLKYVRNKNRIKGTYTETFRNGSEADTRITAAAFPEIQGMKIRVKDKNTIAVEFDCELPAFADFLVGEYLPQSNLGSVSLSKIFLLTATTLAEKQLLLRQLEEVTSRKRGKRRKRQ